MGLIHHVKLYTVVSEETCVSGFKWFPFVSIMQFSNMHMPATFICSSYNISDKNFLLVKPSHSGNFDSYRNSLIRLHYPRWLFHTSFSLYILFHQLPCVNTIQSLAFALNIMYFSSAVFNFWIQRENEWCLTWSLYVQRIFCRLLCTHKSNTAGLSQEIITAISSPARSLAAALIG